MAEGKFAEAAEKLRQFVQREPATPAGRAARLDLARALASAGLNLQATETYAEYLRLFPDDKAVPEARYLLARSYEAQGKFSEAVDAYQRYLTQGNGNPARQRDLRLHIAETYDYVVQQPRDAVREYKKFIDAFPKDPATPDVRYRVIFLTEQRLRDVKTAIEAYAAFVKDYPQDSRAPAAQGQLCWLLEDGSQRDFPRAVQEYRNYIKLFPQRPDVFDKWLRIALLYRDRMNQNDNARAAYDEALKIRRAEAIVWDRFESIWRMNKADASLKALQEFLQEFPKGDNRRVALQRAAIAQNQLGQKDEAIKTLESAIAEFGAAAVSERWDVAERYSEKKDWPKVVEHLSALVRSDSGYAGRDRYVRLANAAVQSKDPALLDQVEKTLIEVLPKAQFIPEHFCGIHWALGQIIYFEARKDHAKAMASFTAMLEAAPFDDWSGASLAQAGILRVARDQKNLGAAIQAFRDFHKKYPLSWNAREGRAVAAQLFLEMKDPNSALAEATQVVNTAMDDYASADATITAAEALRLNGNDLKALAQYANMSAARLEPWHNRVHGRIDSVRNETLKPLLAKLTAPPAPPKPAAPAAAPTPAAPAKPGTPAKPAPAAAKPPAPAAAPAPAPEPAKPAALDSLKIALAQHALGNFAKAMEGYDGLLASQATQPDLAEQIKALRDDAERLSKFTAIYDGGELDRLPTMSLYRRGQDYINQRRTVDAVNAWRLCLARAPGHVPARLQIVQNTMGAGTYATAGPEYIKLLTDIPMLRDEYRHQVAYAWFYYWQDAKFAEPIRQMMAQAADARPTPANLQWTVDLLTQRDPKDVRRGAKYAQAYAALKSYDRDPFYATDRLIEANVLQKQHAKAAELGLEWLKANPGYYRAPELLYRVADIYRLAGNMADQAVQTYKELQSRFPKHGLTGEACFRVNDDLRHAAATAMMEQFVKDNPQSGYVAPMLWRLAGRVPAAEIQRRNQYLTEIWTNFRTRWAENLYASGTLLGWYVEQKQNDAALKLAREMVDTLRVYGAYADGAWDMVVAAEQEKPNNDAAFLTWARVMALQFSGTREVLRPQQRLRAYWLKKGDPLEAAIALQWAMATLPRGDGWSVDEALRIGQTLADDKRFEEAATVVRTVMAFSTAKNADRVKATEKFMSVCLSQSSGGLAVIDPTLPQAGLLMGDVFARAGEDNLAWQKYSENKKIFDQFRNDLSPTYIQLIARRLLDNGDREAAVDLCRSFIIQRQKDKRVSDVDRAGVQLILGDCYFREQRFDIARSEYNTCFNLYPATPQAVQARFKVGECFMAQKMYDKAEELFTDLAKSKDEDTVVRAMLMQGFLYHAQGKRSETVEQFKKVLSMNPRNEVADELFYRMGLVYQESGKLREAYNLFRLVGSGGREAKRYVAPGTQLLFRLSDKDLNITRGESKVPILVETSSGDKETVYLNVSEAGSGIFVGEILTALGPVTPGDRVLQVRGTDTITYRYHPDFVKDFVLDEKTTEDRTVRVAADAELEVSSTEIKEEADEETQARAALQDWTRQPAEQRHVFRRTNEVKPGNNIYIRLADKDRDVGDEKDGILIDVSASSGDTVKLKVVESGAHTGIFRGSIVTAGRPPDAMASDSTEGREPRHAIDGDAKADSAWEGRHDGRMPKWLMVDLKDLYPVTRISWNRGEGRDDRLPLRYVMQASNDNQNWTWLAVVPAGSGLLGGVKPLWEPDSAEGAIHMLQGTGDVQSIWGGQRGRTDWIIDLDLGSVVKLARTVLRPNDSYREVRKYALLVEKDKGSYPGQNRAMDGWTSVHAKELAQPATDEAAFKDVEARYLRIHITQCFNDRPEIGEFEIYPAVTESKVAASADGKGAVIDLPATNMRYVRMFITECQSDAPAVAEFSVWAGDKRLVPSGVDVHKLATNDTLEISPGDTVTVTYNDEVNIHPGEPKVLRKSVKATFYNGDIGVIRHFFFDDEQGNRRQVDRLVYRIDPGERFIVQIRDYDADLTDGVDSVPITVQTSSGEKLDLVATETGPYDGVFTKEVDTAAVKQGEALAVKPGDKITITYIDKENTQPGNTCPRTAEILVNEPAKGSVAVREYQPKPLPGKGKPPAKPAAAVAVAAVDPNRVKLVSLDEPVVVEVRDPDRAKNTGDTVTVKLTTTGGATAEVECFVGGPQNLREAEQFKALKEGLFIGEIRMNLGDKDSPAFVVEALKVDARRYATGQKKSSEVPVLNVAGQDIIKAVYIDAVSPQDPPNTPREDSARLVTNATIGFFDDQYEGAAPLVHVGENLYLKIVDPDSDLTNERDVVKVTLESSTGDKCVVELTETLSHSGIFTRAVMLDQAAKPDPLNDKFEADFDARIKATYLDERNTDKSLPVERVAEAKVVIGSDGVIYAFGRKYPNVQIAVETQFKIGESYYYLGRKHMKLAEEETKPEAKAELQKLAREELSTGQRMLDELVRAFPDNAKIDQAAYLLGSLVQEQQRYDEAIDIYRRIAVNWPESPVAPNAQYHIGMCYEKKGDFDTACDEYVRLAYKYPDNTLVGDAMIRIGLKFFDDKKFPQSVAVFQRFIEKYPMHGAIEEVWFKMGLAQIMDEKFKPAAEHFQAFIDKYPESKLKAAALYWAGDSYMKANDNPKAYQMFKRVVWDFPESKWAKWARGKLTAPVFERME
jgi:TolA-binding protein/uncharacterized protein YndB with AHSA1/START domain